MARLRPAKCHRRIKGPAYTRTAKKVAKKAFITGVPGSKIHIFDLGDKQNGPKHPFMVSLVSTEQKQLRHNQLEAMRVVLNRYLSKKLGKMGYYLKVRVHPHHVLREHSLATGAGADRFSSGMAKAFGKPVGRAARVKSNQKIASIFVPESGVAAAKTAVSRAKHKLSAKSRIVVEPNPLAK